MSVMEAPDYVMASHSSSSSGECPYPTVMMKRKRTKRQRTLPSPSPPPPSLVPASSSTSSADFSTTTEEEEDMAHCLILLAQGRALDSSPPGGTEKFTSRKFTETTTTAGGKAGFYVYECKTCNKCFPSFQALGGHRASHKKPKMAILPIALTQDHKKPINDDMSIGTLDISINDFSKPAAIVPAAPSSPNKKLRVHECSICGAEFSSGQALGGHMRRHRPIGAVPESPEVKKERNVLSLDLNLPAPSDENSTELHKSPLPPSPPVAAFSFSDKRPMVFSAPSSLVDCHY